MPASDIVVKGAREHNLRDIDLVLPRNQLICLTGVSGSGKSSLAFDTLYAEGQRRYVESLSSYARQFLGQMPKPEVDFIGGLSPSISISQKSAGNNPRSTVGTITEIYDYLRVLFARVGLGHCPSCNREITAQSREEILGRILALPEATKFSVLAPLIRRQKGEYKDLFEDLQKQGFARARVDGEVHSLSEDLRLDRQMRHNIEVVIDRLTAGPSLRPRLAEAVDLALRLGKGNLLVALDDPSALGEANRPASKTVRQGDIVFSADYACTHCGLSFEPPSPQLFSFNSPQGMCDTCDGLGEVFSFDPALLVPDGSKNFQQGAVELVGKWRAMGRWRRHIYQGVADTIERSHELEPGTMLETAWEELPKELRELWLWGTGEEHITFTWRGGNSPHKHGGLFDGIIPELITKYRNCQSTPQIKQLEKFMDTISCPDCLGERLNPQARAVSITSGNKSFAGKSLARSGGIHDDDGKDRDPHTLMLPQVCRLSVVEAAEFFEEISLNDTQAFIATEVLKEIRGRLSFLLNVGLDYLSLDRTAPTLSGGESQRIRLAGQIGCGLVGVLYILDEPSIGLHPRDNDRLLESLGQLRDQGNTVLVVEHDEDTIRAADHVIDFGPGPGVRGGEVVAEGPVAKVLATKESVTGQFLSGRRKIEFDHRREVFGPAPSEEKAKKKRKKAVEKPAKPAKGLKYALANDEAEDDTAQKWLTIRGATHNNLKGVDVSIPLGRFVVVTGVSGSGKSSLVSDILAETLFRDLNGGDGHPGAHDDIEGMEHLDKLISIDQTPIGRTPRSNPGTYIKVFDEIRHLFTQMPESKKRGYKPGRFSFNVKGGRCEACEGNGSTKLEMDFLADVWVTCPVCQGHRFNRETLGVQFKGHTISQVLEMDIQQGLELFENQPKIRTKLQTLHDVGLDYMKLGQPSPTLSGGEAQRIKLARQLVKRSTGRTLYLLDEPTTGLHFADIDLLLKVLHGFADGGNTVLVVEHNLDVIKTADWIIDVGPEGGEGGGQIIATGTPEQIAANPNSHTGRALAKVIEVRAAVEAGNGQAATNGKPAGRRHQPQSDIIIRGAHQHNLKHVDATIQRDRMTVFCGPSGSGKSSLAMDTLYAEGQRRYVESLSSYARQFVSQMQKPAVEHVEGLSPAIAIEQKNLSSTPRSTVGTVTEVYDYFRILLARLGTPHCPDCNLAVGTQTADEVIDKIMAEPTGTRMYLMAPMEVEVGRQYETLWDELRQRGYLRIRVDGLTHTLDKPPVIDRRRKHAVEVIIDRITVQDKDRGRIAESVEAALALGRGVMHVVRPEDGRSEEHWPVQVHSQHLACQKCGRSFEALSPHNFSFNSSLGWCEACEGLGMQTGTNPAALLRDSKLTLAEGALALWPNVANPVSQAMLAALGQATNIPLDVPFEQLTARDRRLIFHGTGDQWFTATCDWPTAKPAIAKKKTAKKKAAKAVDAPLTFKFQFKGLYPALEEASRLAPALRTRLERMIDEVECSACAGSRLRDDAAAVRFQGLAIDDWARLPLGELVTRVEKMDLSTREKKIAGELIREITARSQFLVEVGLEYLTLARGAATLSGGEAQRIRLASQLGSGLTGVLYVLDEPTIGLHPRDNTRLLGALYKLRDLGNTLVLVEHDREVIAGSDALCDFGPGAGRLGGEIVARGTPAEIATQPNSVTGPYLAETKAIPVPTNRRLDPAAGDHPAWIDIVGARHNNLRDVRVSIPLGTLTAVTGVSGSGKSSLIEDVLYATLARTLHRANTSPGAHDALLGIEHVNKVIRVDQQALGNSPSSNPATFTGAFELIRQLFAQLPESKVRGYTARQFSFNVAGGRCEACEGNGQLCIEMHFLPDVWVECDTCKGRRYNPETLAVKYHGHSIADVLEMTCGDALRLMANIPKIRRILQTLCDVGLDYLQLGQPAPTLSGGEAQRVKLAAELARPDTGSTLYLLDEPTTGLHFDDLAKLLDVMHRLVDLGNTVVVIEHNLDVIKNADWVLDMGPEAGEGGGRLVAAGTPEQIAAHATQYAAETGEGSAAAKPKKKKATRKKSTKATAGELPPAAPEGQPLLRSHTGEALGPVLAADPHQERALHDFEAELERRTGDLELAQVGKESKMPWEIDGRQWHTVERVGRRGEPCRWEGQALAEVIDRITDLGEFEVNWGARTIVEITGPKKSDGWFFHAITGEAWLVKLKFRVAKNTFKRHELQSRLPLPTLNDLEELPVYGNEPRVTCKNLRGPWQEVVVKVHTLEEIDTPAFWEFIEQAVAGFNRHVDRVEQNPEDVMPWKVLGQKWHLCRKGFPLGKKVQWEQEVLEELLEVLGETAGQPQYLWNNQQVVHLMVAEQREPWASVRTKLADAVELHLNGPAGAVALGRIAGLGFDRQLDQKENRDIVRIRFRSHDDLDRGDLRDFLVEHLENVTTAAAR